VTYATQADLEARFGTDELLALADRDRDGVADAAVVAEALADADNLIDGYVGTRYALPLATVPPLLEQLACDIARYNLYAAHPTEAAKARHDAAIATLKRIADGTVTLQVAGVAAATSGDSVQTSGPDRVFNKTNLEGY
jgi:phage gp36-like protein